MPILGEKYTIVYEAKNFKSSVAGITARVTKSNGSTIGPFVLNEFTTPGYEGIYFAEFNTSLADPVGEWVGVINSPNEDNYKQAFRASFQNPSQGGGGPSFTVQDIVDGVWNEQISNHLQVGSTGETLNLLTLLDIDKLVSRLLLSDVTAMVQSDEPIKGVVTLDENEIKGKTAEDFNIFSMVTDGESIKSNIDGSGEIIGVLNEC
jgi:hypothetical protein